MTTILWPNSGHINGVSLYFRELYLLSLFCTLTNFLCRKACLNSIQQERNWWRYAVQVHVLWLLKSRNRLQVQPNHPRVWKTPTVVGPFPSFFYQWERICWLSENIREGVGIKCNFRENFSEVIDLALPYIIHFLDGMCDGATLQWNRSYQIKLVAGPELWYVVMIAGL